MAEDESKRVELEPLEEETVLRGESAPRKRRFIRYILAAVGLAILLYNLYAIYVNTTNLIARLLPDDFNGYAQGFVDKLNEVRREAGTPSVKFVKTEIADWWATYMADNGEATFVDKNGISFIYYFNKYEKNYVTLGGVMIEFISSASINRDDGVEYASETFSDSDMWDKLTNPCVTHVSIGLKRSGNTVYITVLALHNRTKILTFPSFDGNIINLKIFTTIPPLDKKYYLVVIAEYRPNPWYFGRDDMPDPTSLWLVIPLELYDESLEKEDIIIADRYEVYKQDDGWVFDLQFKLDRRQGFHYIIKIFGAYPTTLWTPKGEFGELIQEMGCYVLTYELS